jgi:predicted transcriptional regulator
VLLEILRLFIAAILGGLITLSISYFTIRLKIRTLLGYSKRLDTLIKEFKDCHEDHINCPEEIRYEYHKSIDDLADVVSALTKTVTIISSTLDAHLKITSQIDAITEKRFVRIEEQLGRIESKLDQLKGWRIVRSSVSNSIDKDAD